MTDRARTAVVADVQPFFGAGIAAALRSAAVEVLAVEVSGEPAVRRAIRERAGVVVLDASLPRTLALVEEIVHGSPGTKVLVVAPRIVRGELLAAVHAGASGYLPRETTAAGLARAAADILEGGAAIPRAWVGVLLRELSGGRSRRRAALTDRQSQVAELREAGLGTGEIARLLGISPITVRRHSAGSKTADRPRTVLAGHA